MALVQFEMFKVHILDGNSELVCIKKGFVKIISHLRLLNKCLKQIKYRFHPSHAHICVGYNIIIHLQKCVQWILQWIRIWEDFLAEFQIRVNQKKFVIQTVRENSYKALFFSGLIRISFSFSTIGSESVFLAVDLKHWLYKVPSMGTKSILNIIYHPNSK